MTILWENLPPGVSADPATGVLTGRVTERGESALKFTARNAKGVAAVNDRHWNDGIALLTKVIDNPATPKELLPLALTNRGGASAQEILELAREVRDGVADRFGIVLDNEPVLVACAL